MALTTTAASLTAGLALVGGAVGGLFIFGASSPEADGYRDQAGYEAEYAAAQRPLPLPEGESYPAAHRPAEPHEYGVGAGDSEALSTYYCAWQDAWLEADRAGEEIARSEAAFRLRDGLKHPANRYLHGYTVGEDLDAAQAGDTAGMERTVTVSCGR